MMQTEDMSPLPISSRVWGVAARRTFIADLNVPKVCDGKL